MTIVSITGTTPDVFLSPVTPGNDLLDEPGVTSVSRHDTYVDKLGELTVRSKNDPFLDVNIELEAIDAVQLQAITPTRNSTVKVDMDNATRRE